MFAVCILFPVFLLWRSPEYAGILGFVLITIFSIFMLLQYVSLKETQYPKASTLLCALPFSRKNIVLSKYIFCILIYLACCLIFGIETLIFPQLRSIGYKVPILLFMVVSLFLGVYLPAQYKLGYEKTKLFFCGAYYGFTIYICAVAKNRKQLHYKYFRQYKPCIFGDL
ncbi:MAG: ABC-2 transporter permease [Bacteroides caccae]